MSTSREQIVNIIAAIFIALLCYAALSKLMNYEVARRAMLNQIFPRTMALVLVWLVPVVELFVVGLLFFLSTRTLGLWAATLLLAAFSIYLLLANNGMLGRTPCSCGGILGKMDYHVHLIFNSCFVALGFLGIALSRKHTLINRWFYPSERRSGKIG